MKAAFTFKSLFTLAICFSFSVHQTVFGQVCSEVAATTNIVTNPSFESGTNGWSVSNGSLSSGSGYQVCGSKNGYLQASGGGAYARVWQTLPLRPVGSHIKFSSYLGVHAVALSCSPTVRLAFYNAAGALISAKSQNITTNVDVPPYKTAKYNLNDNVPPGTASIRIEFATYCDYIKLDAIAVTATSPLLPLHLTSFNCLLNNNRVDLNWGVADEGSITQYIVERSEDGINFSNAGLVMASRNEIGSKTYKFYENVTGVTASALYYRIRSISADGSTDLSESRMVRLGKQSGNTGSLLTYPNPMVNEVRVTLPATWQNKAVSYEVFNADGRLMKQLNMARSSQTEILKVGSLTPGLYIIRASCNGERLQQKIMKQ